MPKKGRCDRWFSSIASPFSVRAAMGGLQQVSARLQPGIVQDAPLEVDVRNGKDGAIFGNNDATSFASAHFVADEPVAFRWPAPRSLAPL